MEFFIDWIMPLVAGVVGGGLVTLLYRRIAPLKDEDKRELDRDARRAYYKLYYVYLAAYWIVAAVETFVFAFILSAVSDAVNASISAQYVLTSDFWGFLLPGLFFGLVMGAATPDGLAKKVMGARYELFNEASKIEEGIDTDAPGFKRFNTITAGLLIAGALIGSYFMATQSLAIYADRMVYSAWGNETVIRYTAIERIESTDDENLIITLNDGETYKSGNYNDDGTEGFRYIAEQADITVIPRK